MIAYPVTLRLQPRQDLPCLPVSASRLSASNLEHLSPLFSACSALFCTPETRNPFPFNRFRTLCQKHPGWASSFSRNTDHRLRTTSSLATRHSSLATKCFACHTSAKSAANLFPCHTSRNPVSQVLCLPQIQGPPEGQAFAVLFSDHWSQISLFCQFGGCFPSPLSAN